MKSINRTGRFAVIFLALCVIMTAFLGTVSFAADRPLGDANGDTFVLPQIMGLILFVLVPLIIAVYLSFCEWNFIDTPSWVGLKNFYAVFDFDGDVFFMLPFQQKRFCFLSLRR